MNKILETTDIRIKYKNDTKAKERFINFLVDYFLEKELYSKKGSDAQ